MNCKSSSTKFASIIAFLLFTSLFQLLNANEVVKSSDDQLNVLQLPVSDQEAKPEALDGVFQVFITRYDREYSTRQKKFGGCIDPPLCVSDSECANSACGHRCVKNGWNYHVCGMW
ncbi:uncharacterized protein LOC107819703 [Nicotiana tabacum]|uniref:Uncharacterized protein LOC107819703 n=2 Tax=Nicotiana TaxID=4085 RepID=A0A1S4CJF6_TOBAC|nr:PREDICTED: uncharacterized protein LOC104249772 [Nicotiana sylvestris]XP_016501328.1 PREDICTED: uncharacterized protein LOC107819703 [Nicotiana tabacum]